MADLMAEFRAGHDAAVEGQQRQPCPFYATSNSADAWHAGVAHRLTVHQSWTVARVWHGRGYLVSVAASHPEHGNDVMVYRVDYDRNGEGTATLQEARS